MGGRKKEKTKRVKKRKTCQEGWNPTRNFPKFDLHGPGHPRLELQTQ